MRTEFPALGKCMYCGSTSELSKEHIIPYGLGGPGVMPKSSCSECADITSKFEREVLKGPLLGLRAYMRLSRRKKGLPKKLPFIVIKNGEEKVINIPITEHPIMLIFPVFSIPSKLSNKKVKGISITGTALYNFGTPIKEVMEKYDADDFKVTESSKPVAFARLIAKIAWGIAIASGYDNQLDINLRDSILYEPNNIGQWVGTYTDPLEIENPNMMHMINIREDYDKGILLAEIKLFANSPTPKYGVILGKLSN